MRDTGDRFSNRMGNSDDHRRVDQRSRRSPQSSNEQANSRPRVWNDPYSARPASRYSSRNNDYHRAPSQNRIKGSSEREIRYRSSSNSYRNQPVHNNSRDYQRDRYTGTTSNSYRNPNRSTIDSRQRNTRSDRPRYNNAAQNNTRANAYGRTSIPKVESRYKDKERSKNPAYSSPVASTIQGAQTEKNGVTGILVKIISFIGMLIISLFRLILKGFEKIWGVSKVAGVGVVLLIVILVGICADGFINSGRIYNGVRIGNVDVSHMTTDEAAQAVNDAYSNNLNSTTIYIFSNQEDLTNTDIDLAIKEEEALAKQMSLEESRENKLFWIASAGNLEATLPAQELAQQALDVGRDGNPITNLISRFSGHDIGMYVSYNDKLLDTLISDIDASISDPCVEFGIEVTDGVASVTEGHDGNQIDHNQFCNDLNNIFLKDDSERESYIAQAIYTPMKITREEAEATCEAVNSAIEGGASFLFDGSLTEVDRTTLGSWVNTYIADTKSGYRLNPEVDVRKGMSNLVTSINKIQVDGDINVAFINENDEVLVQPDRELTIPSLEDALQTLDADLFSKYRDNGKQEILNEPYNIEIETRQYSGSFSVDEALAFGIVSNFSEYTTQYISTSSTQNRIHNIHLACEMINNSITPANGGIWSWNETAGDTSASAGFKEASAISGDEFTTTTGGGICQVATTVFNAVYESGLPVVERHNHTLYIGSYPSGRDAAIAYPILDLRWKNNTESDILMRTNYTETSVTVSLIGENPNLTVTTETGEWQEGEEYVVKTEVEEGLAKDAYYKKTNGLDGSKISVIRTVTDESGNVVLQDRFDSVYSPVNEIIAIGEGSDAAAILEKFKKPEESSKEST